MKMVINGDYGGFRVTDAAIKKLREMGVEWALKTTITGEMYSDGSGPAKNFGGICYGFYGKDNKARTCPHFIKMVEEDSKFCDGRGDLKVIEIPDDIEWEIDNYDGCESVHEVHRSWS